MNINKKFDRLRQWTDERMGSKSRTEVSNEFKDLEVEMGLRYDGMKANNRSMNAYVKHLGYREEGEDKEKLAPVAYLGSTMATHGDDFDNTSSFGQCLSMMGRVNERIARAQDTYVVKATSTWLESTERSLAQMKEYQAARKKLESRRLAYDTAIAKMEKNKKSEDFRLEEECRVQKAKYEESSEDVFRRMQDIQEQEAESMQDLTDFLDAELAYYDHCREVLAKLRQDWPVKQKANRSRSNTAHTFNQRLAPTPDEPLPLPAERPSIRANNRVVSNSTPQSRADSLDRDYTSGPRLGYARATTFEGPRQLQRSRDSSPPPLPEHPLSHVSSNAQSIRDQKFALRPVASRTQDYDNGYDSATDTYGSSPSRWGDQHSSPATSVASNAANNNPAGGGAKKPPPPPPPSRQKKPPPPPPPMKRGMTTGSVP